MVVQVNGYAKSKYIAKIGLLDNNLKVNYSQRISKS